MRFYHCLEQSHEKRSDPRQSEDKLGHPVLVISLGLDDTGVGSHLLAAQDQGNCEED